MPDIYDEAGGEILDEDGSSMFDETPEYYTENLNTNPSFEVDLTGYTATSGALLEQDTTQGFSGHASMVVQTDGTVAGEGFSGPQVVTPSTGTGSMSVYIMGGAGAQLTVSAVSGVTPTIIASTNVILAGGDYQRVILSGLALTASQTMYILVQTTTAQSMNFWVDAIQYEMNSPAHAYIDGNFLTCQWESTPNESASFMPFQFGTSATGGMFLDGRATPVTQGETFPTSAEGGMTLSGVVAGSTVVNPAGALTDFGMWTAADMDPAVSYAGWSNALATTGATEAWDRIFGMFTAPQQYVASGSQVLWKRAAYAAVGFDFKSVLAAGQQQLADVQMELMPVSTASPAPSSWASPRSVTAVVKPTRLNFVPNPSIEVSTSGWLPIGSAVLTRDNSQAQEGTYSLKVAVHSSIDGAYIVIPDLIVGDTYAVSAWTQGGPGLQDITMSCSGGTVSSAEQGIPYGGDAIDDIGFGQGPYGGLEASGSDMPTGTWFNPATTFTATASTVILSFQIIAGTDISYPTEFWVDAALVEVGDTFGSYFDGGYGSDYSWETGGTSGLTRSYYYERQEVAAGAVSVALAEHTPLGISAAAPVYSLPYSQ